MLNMFTSTLPQLSNILLLVSNGNFSTICSFTSYVHKNTHNSASYKTSVIPKNFFFLLLFPWHSCERAHLIKLPCNSRCFYPLATRYFNLSSGTGNIQIKDCLVRRKDGQERDLDYTTMGRTYSFHGD